MSLSEEITCTCGGSGPLDGHAWTCSLRTGTSPAEAQRRREARKRKLIEERFAKLAPDEELYNKIKDKLDEAQRDHIAELRERALREDDRGSYGHDLYHAIQRAKLNQYIELAGKLLDQVQGDRKIELGYAVTAGALRALLQAAARKGISAETLRRALASQLEEEPRSASIERIVERYGPKDPA